MIVNGCKLTAFTELSADEKRNVLKWRNHEDIRKWMYDSKPISHESHLNFIERLKNDTFNQYFFVQKDYNDIGVIYFNKIDQVNKITDLGLYINPFSKIKGQGKILLETCIKYTFEILGFNKLKLEVFSDNDRALNLYKKHGFKEINHKKVNNREVICMELKNGNR